MRPSLSMSMFVGLCSIGVDAQTVISSPSGSWNRSSGTRSGSWVWVWKVASTRARARVSGRMESPLGCCATLHRGNFGGMKYRVLYPSVWLVAVSLVVALGAQGQPPVPPQGRGRGNVELPDGAGKAPVQAYCTSCHTLANIPNSGGFTRDGWRQLLATMVALPREQSDVIVDYLATNFPEQPRPRAVVIAGPTKVSFKEWNLPTLGSGPHDPLATPDGAIWYTGMFANALGRIDPKTGAIKEYPLKTPQSGPHGLTADKDGRIWFTANSKGYIGRL